MIKPQDLLQKATHLPSPDAGPMVAQVRTGCSLIFRGVDPPDWRKAGDSESDKATYDKVDAFGAAHDWSCFMTWRQILDLREFLKTEIMAAPDWEAPQDLKPMAPEAIIDQAMRMHKIGFYIGTFIGRGHGGAEVRMLFAITSKIKMTEIAAVCHSLLTTPQPVEIPASQVLTKLRRMWNAGTDKRESGLMLLANVDVGEELAKKERFPFASIDSL